MGTATKRARDTRRLQRLRERAEGRLGKSLPRVRDRPPGEAEKLVHELSVYQVELEMQNDELRRVELQLADALDLSRKLYDLAPVGHLTLGRAGMVREANLTAARLLGLDRDALVKKGLARFIMPGSQDEFYLHLRKARARIG